ncbi:hypothetical protein CO005_01520 [Candidatus Roizmanbacteria bacterium CG_4_8_14_3_um_filter_34_9]|uniref:Uncharacterized protein n=3 Tax=Candidatus Roizmaniibacteriota TaxID=1752723 RepID=A0A2M7AUB2_9BACT|nr:MAG: hypothetical protein COT02_05415 [Candidatus Roizmanbacteria bacterium CG07_land_8_20_14_0_80_34_15]PIU74179.1 MAG: hypothetical protein COS77_03000 [Candidatus Roizmanbacteria bacterium CG06_land_8_20_14_3_00_34_14]PIW73424.1 MAG: hypothetical protein CO005_01520 [Candidatus Roizmanbacteria bacterium CG_4_8_14_3_um_filter_34_9]
MVKIIHYVVCYTVTLGCNKFTWKNCDWLTEISNRKEYSKLVKQKNRIGIKSPKKIQSIYKTI